MGSQYKAVEGLRREIWLSKRGQLHKIIAGYGFSGMTSFSPSRESAHQHKGIESFFPQQVRHPGAGRFAHSSTVNVDIFIFGKVLDFFGQIVRFEAD